ncbi:L-rhamnose mutarotase [Actinidia chinensis var. chinensis]|uniref:L-rhamnose mutarotase n=1 Tax=Actinidia chinensis var. chinensis TaxID=1590841 RepID=A0A2R6QQR7_ACTCC|nr:L-rhamnose mutarotase [Actinidia chinensis var. chinensis]
MNHAFAACDEMRSSFFCPKPRRLAVLNAGDSDPIWPLRGHASHHSERCESKAGTDHLDIILPKGVYGVHVASSPPFFSGSPPSRVSNPLVQDSRFGDERFAPISPRSIPIPSGSSLSQASTTRKGGCVQAHFGNNPTVRIEGFNCLDRDNRNRSIPALA